MRKEILILAAIVIIVIIGVVVGAKYYSNSVQNERMAATATANAKPKPNAALLIRPDSPTRGPADAKVTLVEFYDPECESCAEFSPIVKRILMDYPGRIRLVARFMPLHPNSMAAANFIAAAGEQGKYWEAMEKLFEKQPEWGTKHGVPASAPQPDVLPLFDKYAKEMGLNVEQVSSAIREKRFDRTILQDRSDGQALGIRRTPTFLVNGRELTRFGEAGLRDLIEQELNK